MFTHYPGTSRHTFYMVYDDFRRVVDILYKECEPKTSDGMFGAASGVSIYVVAEDLIPESKREGHSDLPKIGVMLGFAIMMVLDVALG